MSCLSTKPYNININHDNNNLSYRIDKNRPDGKSALLSKCTELGWTDPLSNKDMKDFINKPMKAQQCFAGPSHGIQKYEIGNNICYINKSC